MIIVLTPDDLANGKEQLTWQEVTCNDLKDHVFDATLRAEKVIFFDNGGARCIKARFEPPYAKTPFGFENFSFQKPRPRFEPVNVTGHKQIKKTLIDRDLTITRMATELASSYPASQISIRQMISDMIYGRRWYPALAEEIDRVYRIRFTRPAADPKVKMRHAA